MPLTLCRVCVATTLLLSFLFATPARALPVTWDFTGAQGGATGDGWWGNTRTFVAADVTLTVTAWGYTHGRSDDALEIGAVGKWSTGLGACNRTETACGSSKHQVDNAGADDWLLFTFSQSVDIASVRIDPWGMHDRDVSYFVGNVVGLLNLTGGTYADLAAHGFGPRVDNTASNSSVPRNVPIGGLNGSQFVNALLIGGHLNSDQDDSFNITSLAGLTQTLPVSVPEPGTLVLAGIGAVVSLRRALGRS